MCAHGVNLIGGGRLRDIQEFLMWIFMHIFRVHQWIFVSAVLKVVVIIQFTQSDEKSKG